MHSQHQQPLTLLYITATSPAFPLCRAVPKVRSQDCILDVSLFGNGLDFLNKYVYLKIFFARDFNLERKTTFEFVLPHEAFATPTLLQERVCLISTCHCVLFTRTCPSFRTIWTWLKCSWWPKCRAGPPSSSTSWRRKTLAHSTEDFSKSFVHPGSFFISVPRLSERPRLSSSHFRVQETR